eukprot:8341608-Pyramimonas_sp.AAC.2
MYSFWGSASVFWSQSRPMAQRISALTSRILALSCLCSWASGSCNNIATSGAMGARVIFLSHARSVAASVHWLERQSANEALAVLLLDEVDCPACHQLVRPGSRLPPRVDGLERPPRVPPRRTRA